MGGAFAGGITACFAAGTRPALDLALDRVPATNGAAYSGRADRSFWLLLPSQRP